MAIIGIDAVAPQEPGLIASLRAMREAKAMPGQNAPVPESAPVPPSPTASGSGSSNLMARNFTSAENTQSRYITANIAGMKAAEKMKDQEQSAATSIMQTAKIQYESAESAGEKYKALKRAERSLDYNRTDEVRKSSEETHLKKSKKAIEDQAQEALAPKDENGNPIESIPTGDVGAAVTPEISTTAPESGSVELPVQDAPGAAAPVAEAIAAYTAVSAAPLPQSTTAISV